MTLLSRQSAFPHYRHSSANRKTLTASLCLIASRKPIIEKKKNPIRAMTSSSTTRDLPILSIDGSQGEGGGQILRNAIAYATIFATPLHVYNIRAGRKKPGLRAQHSCSLSVATQTRLGGRLEGNTVGSNEIRYFPDPSSASQNYIQGDTQTAGSICLLLQAVFPCALFSSAVTTTMTLKGGTNASMAPPFDYWEHVFLPTLQRQCGAENIVVTCEMVTRGFFPRGGGEVRVEVQPLQQPLRPFQLTDRGVLQKVVIHAFSAGNLPRRMQQEASNAAEQYLQEQVEFACDTYERELRHEKSAVGSGGGILLVAHTSTGCLLAGSALSHPKKSFHEMGLEAAKELCATWQDGGCVDEWLQDQLIIFAALAEGTSEIITGSLTLHTQTAMEIAKQMTGARFTVTLLDKEMAKPTSSDMVYGKEGRTPGKHRIQCHGVGLPTRPTTIPS